MPAMLLFSTAPEAMEPLQRNLNEVFLPPFLLISKGLPLNRGHLGRGSPD